MEVVFWKNWGRGWDFPKNLDGGVSRRRGETREGKSEPGESTKLVLGPTKAKRLRRKEFTT
jgi:hypothetical protein